jgi:hypothetical protein
METLAPELARIPNALVIPLGQCVTSVLDELITEGCLDRRRCLLGFPHPSSANGHRRRLYLEQQDRMRQQVDGWFTTQVQPAGDRSSASVTS